MSTVDNWWRNTDKCLLYSYTSSSAAQAIRFALLAERCCGHYVRALESQRVAQDKARRAAK